MADLDKTNIITKLENASNAMEKYTFLSKDISNLKLSKLTLNGHLFKKCNFFVTGFYGCVFENCEFIDCNFNNADFLNVKFLDCTFVKCDFTNAVFQDVLLDGGFKSNCIFKDLDIKDNVVGISEEESNIISENNTDKAFEDKIKSIFKHQIKIEDNAFTVSNSIDDSTVISFTIAKEAEEYGDGIWRVMVGYQWGNEFDEFDSCASDTIDESMDLNTIKTIIKHVIDIAKKYLNDSALDDVEFALDELIIKHLNLNETEINEEANDKNKQTFTQTWVSLSDDDIDMLEQIDSALNHITHDMIDDMVLGEIENLLIKYTEFMNKKIRD